ncbi:hypothetical protein NAEGRDRAFT_56948 [Naegleria gruberi]|uniref:Uncharacterized protein n=1 Tax=Naegleria gruberi TaxID=5762 RepID=D2V2S7_NAEGR|nr:uncharacterized protein NAEGRDRAFT_56948 [Naegleria gruberi]EFC49111.1 hypothetical protein NAEGRDRAFT_56948 [Naegleria gruberi]|eukprot:XP_002681855.1 hypothetical protein NAEGRDRAFT_56948 [Naegleria gruberi strain NEG-M]
MFHHQHPFTKKGSNSIKPSLALTPNVEIGQAFKDPKEAIAERQKKVQAKELKKSRQLAEQITSSTSNSDNPIHSVPNKPTTISTFSQDKTDHQKKVTKIFSLKCEAKRLEATGKENIEDFTKLEISQRKISNQQVKECSNPYQFVKLETLYKDCVRQSKYETYNLYTNWCTIFTLMEQLPNLTCNAKGIEFEVWRVSDTLNEMFVVLLLPLLSIKGIGKKEMEKLESNQELVPGDIVISANPTILQINKKETDTENSTKQQFSSLSMIGENRNISLKVIGKAVHFGTCTYVPVDFNKYTGNNLKLFNMLNEKKKQKLQDENQTTTTTSSQNKDKPLTFCTCPINKAVSRYCNYHFNKKSREVQDSRVECNGANLVERSSISFDKPTVYNYTGVTLFIDPGANVKKIRKTSSDEKPKELATKKKKKQEAQNFSGITPKMANYLSGNSRSAQMFVAARSKQIKEDLLANNKVKDFTDRHINALAQKAVMNTIENATNKDVKKRKFVEIEMSDSSSDDEE